MPARRVVAISRALSDPRRFQIFRHIAGASTIACSDLRKVQAVTAATLSHHLKELEACGLVDTARRGKFLDIRFRRATWEAYLEALRKVA